MRHAVLRCGKCGEFQLAYYPLEEVKCCKCKEKLTEKNILAIASNYEQAHLLLREGKENKKYGDLTRNNFKKLGYQECFFREDDYKKKKE